MDCGLRVSQRGRLMLFWVAVSFLSLGPALSRDDLLKLQSARNVGLAALESDDLPEAVRRFEQVRRLAPADPLGWANGAVAAMRAKDLSGAGRLLAEALRLSPGDARILALEGQRRELAGDTPGAIQTYEKAAAAAPKDTASRWAAARLLTERGPEGRRAALRNLDAALAETPANLFLLLRRADLQRAEGDTAGASATLDRLAGLASGDARLDRSLAEAKQALAGPDPAAANLKLRIVENLLRVTPRFQQARHDVDAGIVGIPIEDWSPALASALRAHAPAAVPVTFSPSAAAGLSGVSGARTVRAAGKDSRDLVFAGDFGLRVARRGSGGWRAGAAIGRRAGGGRGRGRRDQFGRARPRRAGRALGPRGRRLSKSSDPGGRAGDARRRRCGRRSRPLRVLAPWRSPHAKQPGRNLAGRDGRLGPSAGSRLARGRRRRLRPRRRRRSPDPAAGGRFRAVRQPSRRAPRAPGEQRAPAGRCDFGRAGGRPGRRRTRGPGVGG